jgi:hypothetical protein
MENLNKLFTEQEVEIVSEKILTATKDKIKEQISEAFYKETSDYLYQHYDNFKDGLKSSLIKEITEQYVNEPANYQFRELRNKLFAENKEEILKSLTDHAIFETVESILLEYTHKKQMFSWKWNESIAKIILNNWETFKDDERIQMTFGREIDNLKRQIRFLQEKINDVQNVVSEQD